MFLLNNTLTYWHGWPGVLAFFGEQEWFGATPPRKPLDAGAVTLGWIQLAIYMAPLLAVAARATGPA